MFIGIDIGSITSKVAFISEEDEILFSDYHYNHGDPVERLKSMFDTARERRLSRYHSICITGSGRRHFGELIGADTIKNEITAIWRGTTAIYPDVRTIIEIGGQDSKLITLEQGEIKGFRLNSVCAAGTGAFIEQQSNRLNMSIEKLSNLAINSNKKAKFSGRCTVFVETEMVNLQQKGFSVESIACGLFDAICENYLNDLTHGVRMDEPIVFCGGVSEISAVRCSFERMLQADVIVPSMNRIMAAYGAALLARDDWIKKGKNSENFKELKINGVNHPDVTAEMCSRSDCLNCGFCDFYRKPK